MRLTRVHEVFDGERCPKCEFPEPYELSDNRFKCRDRDCFHRYSLKKLNDDANILDRFILGYSARRSAKELGFSYNKVSFRYRKYRGEISEYIKKECIPEQHPITDILKGKKIEEPIQLNEAINLIYKIHFEKIIPFVYGSK